MLILELLSPLLQAYTNIVVGGFSLASAITGIPGYQIMDSIAENSGVPNPESAGVGDVLTHTLSS